MANNQYNPKDIEQKWQRVWAEEGANKTSDSLREGKKKYILDMFPYPSGAGLHVGHVESYTATDIYSRYLRMKGFDVLHPQGFDAFGLPAENYAIKTGVPPEKTTADAIETFKRQINSLGFSYDWEREVISSQPEYYKWTQWLFLELYKNGLAYKKKAKVNWCPKCQTVLANEQAEGGKCERCESEVIQKDLEQWFFKITDFIEDSDVRTNVRTGVPTTGLLSGLKKVDWPNSTRLLQENWIGKSEGVEFKMKIENTDKFIEVFTTRIDTVFGMTYAVVAPEHKIIPELKEKIDNWKEVEKYLEEAKNKTDVERMEAKEKTGVEIKGIKVINPFNGENVPLFVADYVLGHYGTGAVMAVPAHDERDFEFAKKHDLPIRQSIAQVFVGEGKNKVRKDKPNTERDIVDVIIKHCNKDEYFCLDWKYNNWKSFVVGGVEEGETIEEAAIREAQEESGYKNIKVIRQIGGEAHSYFYAAHKGVNRAPVRRKCILAELVNEDYEEPLEEHVKNHNGLWVKKENVANFLSLSELKFYWDILLNGEKAFIDYGFLVNSDKYDGLSSEEAKEKMAAWLSENGIGKKKVNYRLRDWLVSRQRYWGAPIPIIYCEKCGEVMVPEDQLPVMLPNDVSFLPTGESPLKYSKSFQDVKCPKCGGEARRESDTMDTFVCSSWYYLRYADPKNEKEFASKENLEKWLPVDLYVGGAEHSVLHLLYSRFFTKVLHKLGHINFDEPFSRLRHQGTILAEDGTKMSKSKGNVVNPDEVVEKYGADALRMYEMFMGPLEDAKPWNTKGIIGIYRFLERTGRLFENVLNKQTENPKCLRNTHKTIKKVSGDIEDLKFNTAIAALMEYLNYLEKACQEKNSVNKEVLEIFSKLLSPFAPHFAEELWERLGHKNSIFKEAWPDYDEEMTKDEEISLIVQVNGKLRDTIQVSAEIKEDEAVEIAKKSEKVAKYLEGQVLKKTIFVPGKLLNFVI